MKRFGVAVVCLVASIAVFADDEFRVVSTDLGDVRFGTSLSSKQTLISKTDICITEQFIVGKYIVHGYMRTICFKN